MNPVGPLLRKKLLLSYLLLMAFCATFVAGFSSGISKRALPLRFQHYKASATTRAVKSRTSLFLADISKAQQEQSSAMSTSSGGASDHLYDPSNRDAFYQGNVAQYLVDLHDAKATFDFCGGMMFQLVLTDALRDYLISVAKKGNNNKDLQTVIHDASQPRMSMTPGYQRSSHADNQRTFHGREIRQVPTAAGGMGMVLQLSLAHPDNIDNEGWTPQEQDRYDGWGHDVGREWRKGPQLVQEGYTDFQNRFGQDAFSLHHRFYLHLDRANRMWLSAEDGCEGTPAAKPAASRSNLFGLL